MDEHDDPRVEAVARVLDPDAFTGHGYTPEAAAQSRDDALGMAQEILAALDALPEPPTLSDDTHPCNDCGLPYYERVGTYWLADDALWARVVGDDSIVLCPACFRRRAVALGVSFYWRAVADREPSA
jgi:hypothetical protein